MFHMGRLYTTGKGVPRNDALANEWFRKAAAAGSADGIVALRTERERALQRPAQEAYEHAYKAYKAHDYVSAERLLRTAAIAGNARAQVALGVLLRTGLAGPKDVPAALKLFRQAADAGLAGAKAQLGCPTGKS